MSSGKLSDLLKLEVKYDREAECYVAGVKELGVWSRGRTRDGAIIAAREELERYFRDGSYSRERRTKK